MIAAVATVLLTRHWVSGVNGLEGIESLRDTPIGSVILRPFERIRKCHDCPLDRRFP